MSTHTTAPAQPSWEAVLDAVDHLDPARHAPTVEHDPDDGRHFNIAAHGSYAAGIRLSWARGSLSEPAAGKGLHHCAASVVLLRRDARGRTLAERLEQLGAEVNVGATHTATYLDLCCSTDVTDAVLATLAEVRAPADRQDVLRTHARAIAAAQQRRHNLGAVAVDALLAAQTGPDGFSAVEGDADTLTTLTPEQLTRATDALAGAGGRIVVTGGYPHLDALRDAAAGLHLSRPQPCPPSIPVPTPRRIRVPAGRPSGRAVLAWGGLFPVADLATTCAMQALFGAVAGNAGSQWNRLFREELGVTYGSRCVLRPLVLGGSRYLLAYALMTVGEADIQAVEQQAVAICQRIGEQGLPRREAVRAAGRLCREPVQVQASNRRTSSYLSAHLENGLPPGELADAMRHYAGIEAITADVIAQILNRATFCTVSSSLAEHTEEW